MGNFSRYATLAAGTRPMLGAQWPPFFALRRFIRAAAFLPHVRGAYLRNGRPVRGIIAGAGGRHLARADNLGLTAKGIMSGNFLPRATLPSGCIDTPGG